MDNNGRISNVRFYTETPVILNHPGADAGSQADLTGRAVSGGTNRKSFFRHNLNPCFYVKFIPKSPAKRRKLP